MRASFYAAAEVATEEDGEVLSVLCVVDVSVVVILGGEVPSSIFVCVCACVSVHVLGE